MNKHYLAGINSINSAIERDIPIACLFVDKKKANKRIINLLKIAKKKLIPIKKIDKIKLDLMTIGSKHQGIVAELEKLSQDKLTLDDILTKNNLLILVLAGIQDPHNLGACLRSAAAANVDAIILSKHHSASITPIVSKIACGGAEITPIFTVANLNQTLKKITKNNGIWSVALTGNANNSIYEIDFCQSSIIIMGNEEKGIAKNLLQCADFRASIPMQGQLESLNVSVATGIVLFEALRQRGV